MPSATSLIQLGAGGAAALLACAALGKALPWRSWATLAGRIAGRRAGRWLALLLPALEGAVALLAVFSPGVGLAASALLFGAFAVGVLALDRRLRGTECGCFGPLVRRQIGPRLAAANAFFALAAGAGAAGAVVTEANPPGPLHLLTGAAFVAAAFVAVRIRRNPHRRAVRRDHDGLITRRAALQTLAGGALAVLSASQSAGAFRLRTGNPNIFQGSCAEFLRFVKNVGVRSTLTGARKKGAGGITDWDVYEGGINFDGRTTSHLHCSCNDETYETIAECQEACRTSLGCFTGICNPSPPYCVEGTATIGISFRTRISVLKWRPAARVSASCARLRDGYETKIHEHEEGHAKIVRDFTEATNKRLQDKHYRVCAETAADAEAELRKMILRDQGKAIDDLRSRIEAAQAAYHIKHGRIAAILDCKRYCE
jgi:methylamine utilization protein MauE/uncharacterized protein DUF922